MGDQQIDLSGGFVPKSTPAPSSSGASGVDLSGGFVSKTQPQERDIIPGNATISAPEPGITAMLDRAYNRVKDALSGAGRPEAAVDTVGGMALGPIRAAKGFSQASPQTEYDLEHAYHPVKGINNIIGGIGQTVALPAAVLNPAAMAYSAPAIIAQQGVQKGLEAAGADPDYAELGGNVAGIGAGALTGKALQPRVPRSALSKTIKPADPVDFHAAEQSAIPKVNAAAQDLGQPIKTADDALAAIQQAKQNRLTAARESAGPGNNISDLPSADIASLQKDMGALDTLGEHITNAQEAANKTGSKAQPTGAESLKQIATGGAKVAAGAALDSVAPGLGHVAGAFGVLKGAPDVIGGIKDLFSKRALTPENLDAAIGQTFNDANTKPAPPSWEKWDITQEGQVPAPDKPNPAIVASGSTANAPASQPRPIGPNVKPAASTTELDSSLPRSVAPAPTETAPPVKQPLTATTPAAQTAEVLKKAGIQQALKDAGVAAPSATIRQIRPGIDIGPTLQPRMDLSFYGDKTGEGAALMQLTRYNINELRAMAVSRGLDVAPGDSHVALIDKIHDDLSPAEIKEFNDAAAERGISPRATKPKRGYQQPSATVQSQAEAQPASESAPQTDRRQNVDLRAAVESMSPEDQVKAIYQSDKTGLPNKRAFDWAETNQGPARAIGMSDADGLKALNDKYGYAAGDALLKAKAEALQEAGLQAFHDKGDEFMFRGESPEDMNTKLDKAKELLQNRVIRFTGADGKMHEFSGANFSAGVGSDLESAEAALKTQKAVRKASGDAGERGTLGKIKEIK